MKKILTIALILCAMFLYAQNQKRYTVSLTIEEWQSVVGSIDSKRASKLLEDQLIPQIQKEQDSLKIKKP